MNKHPFLRHAVIAALAAASAFGIGATVSVNAAHGQTVDGTLTGEGGDAMTPVMIKLLNDDSKQLSPDFGSYTNVDVDQAIADFVGSAPGSFGADFAVSERPLTTAESATAAANGRSFAYVPFAASPVALVTLVPNSSYAGVTAIEPSQFCQHMPLTLAQLDGIYGVDTPPITTWSDSRLSCSSPTTGGDAYSAPISKWANLDPTMENYALMSLLDSTSASQASFAAGLASANSVGQANTRDTTPSESWPFPLTAYPGGDQATVGKLVSLNTLTGAPSTVAAQITLGAIMPIASVWTGDPLGVPWNLPTAAVQNAQGAFVAPSAQAAEASESDATLASTTDPTTNNLVTFNASTTDAAAYNNYLMLQSYLVVPTNGLPPDKALALAQFIRFALGGEGQTDIEALGAAPATQPMVTAGLKVAQELDVEAAADSTTTTTSSTTSTTTTSSTSTTTTTTSPTGTTTTTSPNATTTTTSPSTSALADASSSDSGSDGSDGGDSGDVGSDGSSSGGLAFTGMNPLPLVGLGLIFFIAGELGLRQLRKRLVKP